MNQKISNTDLFLHILKEKSFDKLTPYCNPSSWKKLSTEEQEQLATLFLKWGEELLYEGEEGALAVFDLIPELIGQNAKIQFQLGLCWLDYGRKHFNTKSFHHAAQIFKELLQQQPTHFESWFCWGTALIFLGVANDDPSHFHTAIDKFKKGWAVCPKESEKRGETLWQWGRCYYFLGQHSQEPIDFQQALKKYEEAKEEECASAAFFNDVANAKVEMGCLIQEGTPYLTQALDDYLQSCKLDPSSFESWLNASCTAQRLFYATSDKKYFDQAQSCFESAEKLKTTVVNLWYKWAELLLVHGRNEQHEPSLQACVEKLERANKCEKENPLILTLWAEALLILAKSGDNLNTYHKAEEIASKSLALNPENPHSWYIYGSILCEMGNYFDDEEYLNLAIEKFQYALTLSEEHLFLWHGLGLCYFYLAELHSDLEQLEKAIGCFEKVDELGGDFPVFLKNWGIALMKIGEIKDEEVYMASAIDKFDRIIKSQGLENCDLEVLYHYGCAFDFLGDFSSDEKEYERAVEVLSFVVEQAPNFVHARFNLALAMTHLGEVTGDIAAVHQALECFKMLIELDSEDEMAWNEWGVALLHLAQLVNEEEGDTQEEFLKLCHEAEHKLRHAAALGNIQAYYPLACTYSMIGEFDTSMHFIERAAQSGILPSAPEIMHDEWLKALRETEDFKHFINRLATSNPSGDDDGEYLV